MRIVLYSILFALPLTLLGQDVHFSQFYSSPLTLNPAETGYFREDYRVGGNFKQQWPWAQEDNKFNYITYSFFGDVPILRDKLPGNDWIGVGGIFLNDFAGDGNLSMIKASITTAYHKVLGRDGKYAISFGVAGTYVQKKVDYNQLYFDNQWNDLNFDRDLPSGENNENDKFAYFDLTAGINFSALFDDKYGLNIGTSIFHLNKPKESFYNIDNRLGIRPAINVKGFIPLNDKLHLEPSVLYMSQKKAQEIIANIILGGKIKGQGLLDNIILLAGISYRAKDALIPIVGFDYKRFRFLANYDVILSTLSNAGKSIGGFEMSIIYKGLTQSSTRSYKIPCPRM